MKGNTRPKDGWSRVRFGDVVLNSTAVSRDPAGEGFTRYIIGKHIDENRLRVESWGDVGDPDFGPRIRTIFLPGDIICTTRGPKLKVATVQFRGLGAHTNFVLRTRDPEVLAQTYLEAIVRSDSFQQHLAKHFRGSVNLFVNWSDAALYQFDLPPIEEQQSRCEVLRGLWESADSYSKTIRVGATLRDSLIAHLYSHGTRDETRVSTPIGELPVSWDVARLDERYEVQLGKMVSPKVVPDAAPCPYLRNENVQWNRLDLSDVKEMGFTARERERFELRYGDVLACEGRHVGKAAMWRKEIPGACYQKALHRLRAKSDAEVPEYILHCFRYYSITKRFVVDTAETTIPHLALERLRPMLFPFPPTSEQEAIVARVSSLDDSLLGAERRLADVQRLMKTFSEGDT